MTNDPSPKPSPDLEALEGAIDAQVRRMQSEKQFRALALLGKMSGSELGQAALRAAQRDIEPPSSR